MPQTDARLLPAFLAHRKRLLRLAYRYLGSVGDAEDIVQEAWLRFAAVEAVEDPARLLSTIVTRLCLDRAKSAEARKLDYVGEWLPEPATGEDFDAPDDHSLDISFAVMRTLEVLTPAERAAFFLHDLWELPFDEIGKTLSRSPSACRKLASRARAALAEAKQRFRPDASDLERFVGAFLHALEAGDPAPLEAVLAQDAELVSDGGGKKRAALNVIRGADAVARFLVGVACKSLDLSRTLVARTVINDAPGLLVTIGGEVDQTFSIDLDATGMIRTVYIVRNPDKLATVERDRMG
jgi:RNA polymerase sigma-70 factor (ECF subfamily)